MSNNKSRRNSWDEYDGADQLPTNSDFHHRQHDAKNSATIDRDDKEYIDVDMEEGKREAPQEATSASQQDDEIDPGKARCSLWVHLLRVTQWRLAGLETMPKEAQVLDKNGISNEMLRAYLVWRRSMLLVALPAIFFSAVLAWINLATTYPEDKEVLNGFGDFIFFIPSAASTVLLLVIVVVLFRWTHWRQTALLFKIGWSISFLLPFLPAIFPIGYLLNSCETLRGDCSDSVTRDDFESAVAILEFTFAIQYAFQLFPILITFPGGLSRASLKIRGLLPESTLSSWILVISAPFQSVIFLMALVLLIQLSGNVPLFIGTILLFSAPWIYVIRRKVYVGVPTEEREKQLNRTQFVIGLFVRLGGVFFLIWAFTADVGGVRLLGSNPEDSVLTYGALIRVIFEAFGRNLATTVLFADVLLRMTVTNWRQDQGRRRESDNGKRIDELFGAIEHSISSDKSKEARSEDGSDTTKEPHTGSEDGGSNKAPDLGELDEHP